MFSNWLLMAALQEEKQGHGVCFSVITQSFLIPDAAMEVCSSRQLVEALLFIHVAYCYQSGMLILMKLYTVTSVCSCGNAFYHLCILTWFPESVIVRLTCILWPWENSCKHVTEAALFTRLVYQGCSF